MRLFPLLAASSLAYTLHAQATQEQVPSKPTEQKTLDPIYAQAIRESARDHEYANTTTIDAKSLQSRQATSLRDVFALDSSISIGGATTTAQKVYIRGFEDRLYSVNIDNASQYGNLFHHQGNITIDPTMIKDISVQKGTPDAYMGVGALAGSMSIRTKDAHDFLRYGQKYGTLVELGGYSNQGFKTHLAGFFALKNTDALLSVNWTNILGFSAGNGQWVQGSANNNKSLLFKLNQQLSKRNTLTLSYNGFNETSTAPFATNLAVKNVTLFTHTNYNHTATLGFTRQADSAKPSSTQMRTNLYFNQRSLYLKPLSLPQTSGEHDEVREKNIAFSNVGYNLALSNQFSVLDLEYGLNYQGVFVADTAAPKDTINRAREGGHIYGGFIKTSYVPNAHWVLGVQSRYDIFNYFDKNNQTHLTQGFSPAASITYFPISTLSFRASYAYLTRGAMPGDATILGNKEVLIHKALRKESIQNIELNVDYSGSIFCARMAGYYSRLGDFINSYAHDHDHDNHVHTGHGHDHGGLRQNMQAPIEVFGYEGGVGADYKNFSSYASIAQSFPTYKGYLLQDTYELGAVYGIIYNLSLQYEFPRYHLRFAWLSQFTQRIQYKGYDIYNDQTGFIDKAGYSVHNLYINWEPLGEKRLSLRLSANNIFNTFYIAQTSPFKNEAMESLDSRVRLAMPNPGIDVRFEVGYQF